MASVVLGVVGAVIGGVIGGPAGAQAGYVAGSTIGSLLDPQKLPAQYGPKLTDLKVTTSTYGTCLPRVYSAMRLAGNIIASSPLIEHSNTVEQNAKGGPTQTSTTFSYTQHFAIAICEGEITGIRKIWANGTLIYNISDGADISTVLASNKIADSITVYTGNETQMPDAFIQSLAGEDKTPAFRGTAYAVFKNFQLEKYGNRTPNLEFEVLSSGSSTYNLTTAFDFPLDALNGFYTVYPTPPIAAHPTTTWNYPTINNNNQQAYIEVFVNSGDYAANINKQLLLYDVFPDGTYHVNKHISLPNVPPQYPPLVIPEFINVYNFSKYGKSYDNSVLFFAQTNYGNQKLYCIFNDASYTDITTFVNPDAISGVYNGSSYSVKNRNSIYIVNKSDDSKPQSVVMVKGNDKTFIDSTEVILFPASPTNQINDIDVGENFVYVLFNNQNIYQYDLDLNFIQILPNTGYSQITQISCNDGDKVYGASYSTLDPSKTFMVEYSTGTPILVTTIDQVLYLGVKNPSANNDENGGQKLFFNNYNFYFQSRNPYDIYNETKDLNIIIKNLINTNLTLDEIVTDIVELSEELTAADIDVSSLVGETVDGYMLGSIMSIRQALEPLMQSYYFDAVETDNKIVFVKRGTNTSINIPEDDLSASPYGSELPDQLYIDRKQSFDLPEEVTVSYLDVNANYNIGSQYSRRLINKTVNTNSLQLPMSLDQNKAKQISDVLLYNVWQERTTFKFTLSDKYLYLNPADVITVNSNGNSYLVRIIDQDYSNHIITVNAVEEDTSIYSQDAVGSDIPIAPNANPDGSINLIGSSNFKLLDIPLLRDQDDNLGFYAAAAGFTNGWTGCQPFKSIDNGASFGAYGPAILSQSTIGVAQTVLGDFYSGDIFDELNEVNIYINGSGGLSSATELSVLNGTNIALVGNEIIQFKNATLIAANTYKLSGMIRGKFGTEREMGNHFVNDTFVLLNFNSTYVEISPSSEYNLSRDYKAVSFGQNIEDALDIVFTNTAVAQKPYNPVEVTGGRDSSGNATLNWVRRTRIGGSWSNYTDVPVGETVMKFTVEIMNGSTIVRTIEDILTQNYIYTTADQITDFGTIQSSITYRVYQISSVIGRGYPGEGTF